MDETATLGYPIPVLGRIADALLRVALPISDMRRHVREEGANLAGLFEP
ncbi:hypothetical protein [Nocardia thraciensis]